MREGLSYDRCLSLGVKEVSSLISTRLETLRRYLYINTFVHPVVLLNCKVTRLTVSFDLNNVLFLRKRIITLFPSLGAIYMFTERTFYKWVVLISLLVLSFRRSYDSSGSESPTRTRGVTRRPLPTTFAPQSVRSSHRDVRKTAEEYLLLKVEGRRCDLR